MKKKPEKSLLKAMKKASRDAQLEREKLVGKVRAKTFGGKPCARQMRKVVKNALRNLDKDGLM